MVVSLKDKVIRFLVLGLIAGFFGIPFLAYCFFDLRVFSPRRAASVLLFFFR